MIAEKHFTLSHSAFWNQLLPLSENYIRECNVEAGRFVDELDAPSDPSARGLINEMGFRVFARALLTAQSPRTLSLEEMIRCASDAKQHISGLRQFNRARLSDLDVASTAEAIQIAERLGMFFAKAGVIDPTVFPEFPGCGLLDRCYGDVLAGTVLFEIKAGSRGFRSVDLRQLLCYCALGFSSKAHDIAEVCLVNPRSGRYFTEKLEVVCDRLAGRSATSVLSDIVAYVSDPPDRYGVA